MKNKYLIQYTVMDCIDEDHFKKNVVKVKDFTDKELENFCKGKDNVKVTFLCIVDDDYDYDDDQ